LALLSTLIFCFGVEILGQFEHSGAGVIFRKFIDTPARIFIGPKEIEVRLNKRANNPILIDSGFVNSPFRLPWLQNKTVRITLR